MAEQWTTRNWGKGSKEFIPTPGVVAAAKKTGASTPAPKKDQIKGSDTNKQGSADGKGKVKFDAKTEEALRNKVAEHNKTASKGRKATLPMLKAVYRRGAGAYSTSHRPGKTRGQWAMARVNAFLRLLSSGRPKNSAYVSDNDLLPASHPKSTKKSASVVASGLIPEEQDLANALLEVVAKHGKFDQDGDGVWAGYTPASENKDKAIGVACHNCVFFQAPNACQIISLEVEHDGKCRFAVLPEGAVKGYDQIPLRREDNLELLLATAYAEKELEITLGAQEDYETPESAILALTEFSGLGYDAEPAIRASWLRAVRNNENPFKRASMLATMTYDSLDADLLPRGDK